MHIGIYYEHETQAMWLEGVNTAKQSHNFHFSRLTFSICSKSSVKSQSLSLAWSSLTEDIVRTNCSAVPRTISGWAIWASMIFVFSSSVGNIVFKIFYTTIANSYTWTIYKQFYYKNTSKLNDQRNDKSD